MARFWVRRLTWSGEGGRIGFGRMKNGTCRCREPKKMGLLVCEERNGGRDMLMNIAYCAFRCLQHEMGKFFLVLFR